MLIKMMILSSLLLPTLSFAFSEPTECVSKTRVHSVNLPTDLAVKLCAGTKNAKATIDCFKEAVRSSALNLNIETAIQLCTEK